MKTLFRLIGAFVIVAIVASVLLHFLMPYIGEDWNSFLDNILNPPASTTANTSQDANGSTPDSTHGKTPDTDPDGTEDKTPDTQGPDTTGKEDPPVIPNENQVAITVKTYTQDPVGGEYGNAISKTVLHDIGEPFVYTPTVPQYYVLDESKSNTVLAAPQNGDVISVYLACETCTVTFVCDETCQLIGGELTQTLRKGQTPVAPTINRFGYTFKGFDKSVSPVYEDTAFTPQWELNRYTVSLHVAEGTSINSTLFTVNSETPSIYEASVTSFETLLLPTPSIQNYTFIAWNTARDGSGEVYTAIPEGITADLTLYAIFNVKFYTMEFEAPDGLSFSAYYLPADAVISSPRVSPALEKAGHSLVWYTDKACTNAYNFGRMPNQDTVLYGKWVLDTGTGFLAWDIANESVDSFEELVIFVDYVRFHSFPHAVEIEVTYTTYKAVMEDLGKVDDYAEFRANGSLNYSSFTKGSYTHAGAKCAISIEIGNSYRDAEATLSAPANSTTPYTYLAATVTGRGNGYTAFYIDALPNSFPVTTSNQLLYVVEHGYRPIPTPGSSAEKMLNEAKKVLNRILPENATDLEKVELIFQYLVTNVQYDTNAVIASEEDPDVWPYYDAYYLEGVFNNRKAVCDGIAKAFSLLCNIEGIPAVEVAGTAHAWNRVMVNNRWYVVDATYGNVQIPSAKRSIMDHSHFMITDEAKETYGNFTKTYSRIVANTEYDYFGNKNTTVDGQSFDFVITSVDELTLMLKHLKSLKSTLSNCSIDFVYSISGTSFSNAYKLAVRALQKQGISVPSSYATIDGSYGSVCKLIFS